MHRPLAAIQFLLCDKGHCRVNAIALESKKVTLVETLDRALNKGVVVCGDLTISVADVDLIFVGLKLLLASVGTADEMRRGYKRDKGVRGKGKKSAGEAEGTAASYGPPPSLDVADEGGKIDIVLPGIDARPERVEKGLGKLVLTLIELIRQLIVKQAERRVEGRSLADEEIERLGETLMKLENKMEELKKVFGLKDEDLTLDLGPLGDLM
jgi:Gas vesicle protein K/Gas vesicle protein